MCITSMSYKVESIKYLRPSNKSVNKNSLLLFLAKIHVYVVGTQKNHLF